jgi:hypothetical protein
LRAKDLERIMSASDLDEAAKSWAKRFYMLATNKIAKDNNEDPVYKLSDGFVEKVEYMAKLHKKFYADVAEEAALCVGIDNITSWKKHRHRLKPKLPHNSSSQESEDKLKKSKEKGKSKSKKSKKKKQHDDEPTVSPAEHATVSHNKDGNSAEPFLERLGLVRSHKTNTKVDDTSATEDDLSKQLDAANKLAEAVSDHVVDNETRNTEPAEKETSTKETSTEVLPDETEVKDTPVGDSTEEPTEVLPEETEVKDTPVADSTEVVTEVLPDETEVKDTPVADSTEVATENNDAELEAALNDADLNDADTEDETEEKTNDKTSTDPQAVTEVEEATAGASSVPPESDQPESDQLERARPTTRRRGPRGPTGPREASYVKDNEVMEGHRLRHAVKGTIVATSELPKKTKQATVNAESKKKKGKPGRPPKAKAAKAKASAQSKKQKVGLAKTATKRQAESSDGSSGKRQRLDTHSDIEMADHPEIRSFSTSQAPRIDAEVVAAADRAKEQIQRWNNVHFAQVPIQYLDPHQVEDEAIDGMVYLRRLRTFRAPTDNLQTDCFTIVPLGTVLLEAVVLEQFNDMFRYNVDFPKRLIIDARVAEPVMLYENGYTYGPPAHLFFSETEPEKDDSEKE